MAVAVFIIVSIVEFSHFPRSNRTFAKSSPQLAALFFVSPNLKLELQLTSCSTTIKS